MRLKKIRRGPAIVLLAACAALAMAPSFVEAAPVAPAGPSADASFLKLFQWSEVIDRIVDTVFSSSKEGAGMDPDGQPSATGSGNGPTGPVPPTGGAEPTPAGSIADGPAFGPQRSAS